MKKKNYFLINPVTIMVVLCMLVLTVKTNAQEYYLNFAATGAATTIDSIKVENLTHVASLTLHSADLLHLIVTTGIDETGANNENIHVYPNPMNGQAEVSFLAKQAGNAQLTIYDISGKKTLNVSNNFSPGIHKYQISDLVQGMYFIIISGENYIYKAKLLSLNTEQCVGKLEYLGSEKQEVVSTEPTSINSTSKSVKTLVDMIYRTGDNLRFTGFSGTYTSIVNDVPSATKTITFNFTNLPTLTTTTVINITQTTATSGGNIISDGGLNITSRGVCWSTSSNPTVSGSHTTDGIGTGSFTSNITGLTANTIYYVKAYATNSTGTSYGNEINFITTQINGMPTLTTTAITVITQTTAVSGGNITSDGGTSVTARGLCWSTSSNPTISDSHTTDGTGIGSFTSNINGLTANTIYYVKAYATNSSGTAYGNEINFTTTQNIGMPTLTTTAISAITQTAAASGGNITSDGGASVTARGVCWGTSSNPTVIGSHTTDGTGTGSFTSNITGLTANTIYYVKAYATNSTGTSYGNEINFTTTQNIGMPTLTTTAITALTQTTAASGGNITSDGGATVTVRGICWRTTSNPVVTNSHTTDGSGTGSFSSSINGLSANTLYYVRAYATNSSGTSYGNEISFTTSTTNLCSTDHNVYLTDIAFVDAATAITLGTYASSYTNLPPTIVYNSTNPDNLLDVGKPIRFKIKCYNNKVNGTSITSGSCKIRTTDPKITITDSTSFLNNVGWNNSAWSIDEFEITVSNTVTQSYTAYVDFVVVEGSNQYYTKCVPIPIKPFKLRRIDIDDDNNPDSHGNDNNISETGETVEFTPYVDNASSFSASKVAGFIKKLPSLSGISIWDNHAGASGNVVAQGWWNFQFALPQPIPVGDTAAIAEYDFVFDYNYTSALTFQLQLFMVGGFQLFGSSGSSTLIRTSLALPFNAGYPVIGTATLSTTAITSITDASAISGGNIANDGGTIITARGVCWSTNQNPVVTGSHTTDGNGTGSFISNFTGLAESTVYYVRAYATNSAGTSYGNQISFTTLQVTTLTTTVASNISQTTATSGGNISDGGITVTARGVCWSTSPNPTTADSYTTDGTGSGTFTSSLTNLLAGTLYYVRAYATNSVGTGYGNEISFTTSEAIGQSYQGGIIFYIDETGQHGLIAAPTDQSTGAPWGCPTTAITGADGTAIGTGNQNTIDIEAGCTTAGIAARLCSDLVLGGYNDWYLPSQDELNLMYLNRFAIGNFTSNNYWSSSEVSATNAMKQNFGNGSSIAGIKIGTNYVRAVRSF